MQTQKLHGILIWHANSLGFCADGIYGHMFIEYMWYFFQLVDLFLFALTCHLVVEVIIFLTEYKQWRTEYMSNITTTINIDDPVGGHQRSQRLIGLATTYLGWSMQ